MDQDRRTRYLRLKFSRDLRREIWAQSRRCHVPFKLLVAVEKHAPTNEYYATLVMLLETKTFKSTYRQSVALQARNWFENAGVRVARPLPMSLSQAKNCAAPGMDSRVKKMPRFKAQQAHLRRTAYGDDVP